MKCKRKNAICIAGAIGAIIGMISACFAIKTIDKKSEICCEMKKKAKKAFKEIEEKIDV